MTTPQAHSARTQLVQEALETAIHNHGFGLHYQAQNELKSQQLIGFEALCRLHTETLGAVSPEEFIPLAESTGLICALERQVLAQVAKDFPRLLARYPGVRVGVNLSARHLAADDFFSFIQAWLDAQPASMVSQLDFEITETNFQFISPQIVLGLEALRQRGIRIVMDDFGSGQSSLSRLHRLPFDVIKLDKQFAQQMDHPMVHAIVKAAIDFTHQFKLGLVIEGVETQKQSQALQALGAEIAQGFLFGKPAPLTHWLPSA